MKRLTERDEFGNADIAGVNSGDFQLGLAFDEFNLVTDALNRLAAYEDTGFEPEDIALMKSKYGELLHITGRTNPRKLRELVEADKDGRRWVPASERFPDKDGYFLCWFDSGIHGIFSSGPTTSRALWSDVTHWMPLPDPPEGTP